MYDDLPLKRLEVAESLEYHFSQRSEAIAIVFLEDACNRAKCPCLWVNLSRTTIKLSCHFYFF